MSDGGVAPLLDLCVKRLARSISGHGLRSSPFGRLPQLPDIALERLLGILVASNALSHRLDPVLQQALTPRTYRLGLEGSCQLRRNILASIGPSCPQLRCLDLRRCQQVGNRIVREVLQHCEHLEVLLLEGCKNISDGAFTPASSQSPLVGLGSLRELSVSECVQITSNGLMDRIVTRAPHLAILSLACCRLTVTDQVASTLLFECGLARLDMSYCSQVTDGAFVSDGALTASGKALRELKLTGVPAASDATVEQVSLRAPNLEVLDAGWTLRLTDSGVRVLCSHCLQLRKLSLRNTQITDASFQLFARCRSLMHLDASWCSRASTQALDILAGGRPVHEDGAIVNGSNPVGDGEVPTAPIEEFILDHIGFVPWASPSPSSTSVCLSRLVTTYAGSVRCLMLIELASIVSTAALEAIARECHSLRELALSLPPVQGSSSDAAAGSTPVASAGLETALRAIGTSCAQLSSLTLDVSARPHTAVVSALAWPAFPQLRSLALDCACSSVGLQDSELELLLSGRTTLESLTLRGCQGLSEGLFPGWCRRRARHRSEARASEQLDALLDLGLATGARHELGALPDTDAKSIASVSTEEPGCVTFDECVDMDSIAHGGEAGWRVPMALRSITSLFLGGAKQLSDNSVDSLAELLLSAQSVELHGCPLLTLPPTTSTQSTGQHGCPPLKSLKKRCRFLRTVSLIAKDRKLHWHASASNAVGKRTKQRSRLGSGGSIRDFRSELSPIAERWGQEGSSGAESSS